MQRRDLRRYREEQARLAEERARASRLAPPSDEDAPPQQLRRSVVHEPDEPVASSPPAPLVVASRTTGRTRLLSAEVRSEIASIAAVKLARSMTPEQRRARAQKAARTRHRRAQLSQIEAETLDHKIAVERARLQELGVKLAPPAQHVTPREQEEDEAEVPEYQPIR